MASPHQVKFCYALQEYFEAEFWFHLQLESNRQKWWKIELGDKCKILNRVYFKKIKKYLSLDILKELNRFNPDIIMIGGFTFLTNIVTYIWGRKKRKKIIIFSEVNRTKNNKLREKGFYTKLISLFYKNIDIIFASSAEAKEQFENVFNFKGKVETVHYATDLESYSKHPLRTNKEKYNILFPNRLTDIYNPLFAIDIFSGLLFKYPNLKLYLNASGELRPKCEMLINKNCIKNNVEFLDNIKSWDGLNIVYQNSDIMLLPAVFSAGNFTIIEAMASGMGIVISNKIFGSGNYITNDFNGYVCNITKLEFINAIKKYFDNPKLLSEHGAINKKYAQKYSIKETAILYYNIINKIFYSPNNP
jgi:glycosyltransferase involved in cell wall biosynthesis